MTDTMHIRELTVECIIGTRPEEREKKQPVVINVDMACDLRIACRSDNLADTVNYSELRHRIIALTGGGFCLIEKLAQEVADLCLQDERVESVAVTIDKPESLEEARSAGVRIHRTRASTVDSGA